MKNPIKFLFLSALLFSTLALSVQCDVKRFVMAKFAEQQYNYFRPRGYEEKTAFSKLTRNIYTFRYHWYRNIIITTEKGLIVIDPFNEEAATALRKELAKRFPSLPVHMLIYSHYHLDHSSGGAALQPTHVLAHRKCKQYWKDLKASEQILHPTRFIEKDVTLKFGELTIEMLYLGDSHTDTLYAFYFPTEKLLFTADLGMVKTIVPLGLPDRYGPGYIKAMQRLSVYDFTIFVPSHFGYGTKEDFIDSMNYFIDMNNLAKQAYLEFPPRPDSPEYMEKFFLSMYDPMRKKYGKWHGFDQMALPSIFRFYIGAGLGF